MSSAPLTGLLSDDKARGKLKIITYMIYFKTSINSFLDNAGGDPDVNRRQAIEAFDVFDHEQNKTVDSREIGAIIRSLGNSLSTIEIETLKQYTDEKTEMIKLIRQQKR